MNFLRTTHQYLILFFSPLYLILPQSAHCQSNNPTWSPQIVLQLNIPESEKPLSFTHDSLGILFLATGNRVYRYNGSLTTSANLPGPVKLTCAGNGKIAVAGKNSLGFIDPGDHSNFSLKPVNSPLLLAAGNVKQLISSGSSLLLLFDQGLFRYNENGLHQELDSEKVVYIYRMDKDNALVISNRRFYHFSQNILEPCKGNSYSPGDAPDLVFYAGAALLMRFGNNWKKYESESIQSFTPHKQISDGLSNLVQMVGGSAAGYIGLTADKQLRYFTSDLIPSGNFDLPSSLGNASVCRLEDSGTELPWVITSNSLYKFLDLSCCVAYPSSITGLQARIDQLIYIPGNLLIQSGNQLYNKSFTGTFPDFKWKGSLTILTDPMEKVLAMGQSTGTRKDIGVITTKGISLVSGEKMKRVTPAENYLRATIAAKNDEIYVQEGSDILHFNNLTDKQPYRLHRRFPDEASWACDTSGRLWILTGSDSLFILDGKVPAVEMKFQLRSAQFEWMDMQATSRGIIFLTSDGLYRFNTETDSLEPFLSGFFCKKEEGFMAFPLSTNFEKGNTWIYMQQKQHPGLNHLIRFDADDNITAFPLPGGPENISAFCPGPEGYIWAANGPDLYCLDYLKPAPAENWQHTILVGLTAGELSISSFTGTVDLPAGNSAFTIQYKNTGFYGKEHTLYRYWLQGAMADYSSWTTEEQVTFSGLRPGIYSFKVESRTIPGQVTSSQELLIKIPRSFFLRWFALVFYGLFMIVLALLYIRWRAWHFMQEKIRLEDLISKRTEELTKERDKSEQLLANILPKDTADELKKKGKASSQKYELVTVLFSDIQGFTRIAEQMNPETLIDQLDSFYFQFDSVVEKYNIEKIKTIGDAYMCAGGIPDKNRTNPVEVVLAGLEMQQFMKDLKATNADIWDLRIGIHTGPVIAGVVGHKKFSYDIWGDTVNVASRMESSGEAGKVNISGHTYEQVREFFICEYRGRMPVKYKGEIDMYFVKGIRPELSLNLKGLPNRHFFTQLQNLRLLDLEEFIVEKMEKSVTPQMYFHNLKYTADVYTQCELLGRAEGLSDDELLILRTAGLFHGIGFTRDYANPASASAEFAAEVLPGFRYEMTQVEMILILLKSRENGIVPESNLEKIFSDACLNYLGRPDYPALSEQLMLELNAHGKQYSVEDWIRRQEKFLSQHQFYTPAARRLREFDEATQVKMLREKLSGS